MGYEFIDRVGGFTLYWGDTTNGLDCINNQLVNSRAPKFFGTGDKNVAFEYSFKLNAVCVVDLIIRNVRSALMFYSSFTKKKDHDFYFCRKP